MRRALPLAALLLTWGCASAAQSGDDAAESVAAAARPSDGTHSAGIPHGDHTPKYGGIVMMNGDLHFEVVATPGGEFRVYFSDEMRRELPASIVSEVEIAVMTVGKPPVVMKLNVDEAGEYWAGHGQLMADAATTLRVSYQSEGEKYWIDIQWMTPAPGATVL